MGEFLKAFLGFCWEVYYGYSKLPLGEERRNYRMQREAHDFSRCFPKEGKKQQTPDESKLNPKNLLSNSQGTAKNRWF